LQLIDKFTDYGKDQYNQIDFDLSTKNGSYGPGFLRAKQNGIKGINAYKKAHIDTNIISSNIVFDNGQRVFHQKFGMGLIISSDGDKLNINFDKAGEKKVVSSFVKLIE
jgi:DNA helicase-2/ATP-dependent DNA helicase PcrA